MQRIIPLVLCFWVSAVSANVVDLPITISDQPYVIELTENTTLMNRSSQQLGGETGDHYYGTISQVEDSWARVSKVAGKWQGIASILGILYVVDQSIGTSPLLAQAASVIEPVQVLSNFSDNMGSCGSGDHGIAQSVIDMGMMSEPGVVAETTLSTFCQRQVNGVCILPEIEFVFDLEFQALFGADAMTQATALVNTAEGFYNQDRMEADGNNGLNMAFDAMTFTFLTGATFTSSTDSGAFLGDIQVKKAAGLPFTQNIRALTHVVTGRDFDGSTVGIAFVDAPGQQVICNANGFSSGTSSVVGSGTNRIPLTAVIVAHEIGHNLGANHDSQGSNAACPSGTHIMSPSISSSLSGFSACSVADIESAIARVASPELCFSFPIDIDVVISNQMIPGAVNTGDLFNSSFTAQVTGSTANQVNQIVMNGELNTGARFVGVTANGNACSLATLNGIENSSYECTVNSPPAGGVAVDMVSEVTGLNEQVVIESAITIVTANNGTIDSIVTGNVMTNSVTNTINVADLVSLSAPVSNSSSGGGGGSLGWPLMLSLGLLLFYRKAD